MRRRSLDDAVADLFGDRAVTTRRRSGGRSDAAAAVVGALLAALLLAAARAAVAAALLMVALGIVHAHAPQVPAFGYVPAFVFALAARLLFGRSADREKDR